jgi:Transcription initiation factor TFIID component TAF4 family
MSTENADNLLGTHSYHSGDPSGSEAMPARHKIAEIFRRVSQTDRAAEDARLAKRARRSASANPEATRSGSISTSGALDITSMSPLEAEKKTTKKDKKLAESKFTEAQQHKSANETARGALGSLIGKKGKSYSWMTGGTNTPKAVSSPVPTPAKISAALAASNSSTPNGVRPATTPRGGQFGDWDEDKEPSIQARDLLLVLETDGRAPRSLMKGYNVPESRD